jgi:hypothetical protein
VKIKIFLLNLLHRILKTVRGGARRAGNGEGVIRRNLIWTQNLVEGGGEGEAREKASVPNRKGPKIPGLNVNYLQAEKRGGGVKYTNPLFQGANPVCPIFCEQVRGRQRSNQALGAITMNGRRP